ncbi:hypothetical protein ACIQB5_31615 [Streptomyces sp. NPDC088560]|uniref:hypothetical protein n=1 Tax=Streptomyces sp. NPDC088560 TaxID=3365868 RepID=UPI0038150233
MAEQKSSAVLAAPLHGVAPLLWKVPGVEAVGKAAQETLDEVGAVSPRRRLAVYDGAGVLAVTGVVEWPVALTGAAVAGSPNHGRSGRRMQEGPRRTPRLHRTPQPMPTSRQKTSSPSCTSHA